MNGWHVARHWATGDGLRPEMLDLLRDHHVSQMQREPTREGRVLCTNKPSLVKAMPTIPGISDHDAILADCDIRPAFCKKRSPERSFFFQRQTGRR